MVDFNYYKSLYEREQDLRIAHNNRLSFTITLTVAIITADAFLCNEVSPWNAGTPIWLFLLVCITLLLLLFLQIVFIFLSFASIKFRYLDFPVDQLEEDIQDHLREYQSNQHWATDADIEKEKNKYIPGMLERTYILCAKVYYKENIRQRKHYFWVLIISIVNVFLIICFYIALFIIKIEEAIICV